MTNRQALEVSVEKLNGYMFPNEGKTMKEGLR